MSKKILKVMNLTAFVLISLLESKGMGNFKCNELKDYCYGEIKKWGKEYSLCTRLFTPGDPFANDHLYTFCSHQGTKGMALCDAILAEAKKAPWNQLPNSSKICE